MDHGRLDPAEARGMKVLKVRIARAKIPPTMLDKNIKVATWNIRNFRGSRMRMSLHYIAEILSNFQIISIVELGENTRDLERVMGILGPYWRAIYSDINMDKKGNRERIGYLYDGRVVEFTGLAAEADPIRKPGKKKDDEWLPAITWWRSPYMASFRAGRFDFVLLSAHVRWGGSSGAGKEGRRAALEELADWVDKRRRSRNVKDKDMIVMGDLNIPKKGDRLYKAITKHGLVAHPKILGEQGTNLERNKRYDQIFYYEDNAGRISDAGSVDFYCGSHAPLYGKSPGISKLKFTFQMSDHLPLWIELKIG